MDNEMKEIYFNPALPGSFGGVSALSRASNRKKTLKIGYRGKMRTRCVSL